MNGDLKPHSDEVPATTQSMHHASVFHGYPNYPTHASTTIAMPSLPPHIHDGIDNHHLPPHPLARAPATSRISNTGVPTTIPYGPRSSPSEGPPDSMTSDRKNTSLLPEIEPRRRKFILVEDIERNNRVRVKVNLDSVDIAEIPDSYRENNSVYPRSFLPIQMQLSPRSKRERRARGRFAANEVDDGMANQEIRTSVKLPVVEGEGESRGTVPGLGRVTGEREEQLNDLGYRMSWSQSRVFAGRVIFLQRSCE